MRTPSAVLLLAALSVAAPVPKVKVPPDTERLVGTWTVNAVNGQKDHGGSHTFVFEAEGECRSLYGDKDENVAIWAWAIDPEEAPRRMTLKRSGKGDPLAYECVYEVDAEVLKIAFPAAGKGRPAKVGLSPDAVLYEMKRVPPTK